MTFKPGQSGNPAGAPRGVRHTSGVSVVAALREQLVSIDPETGKSNIERIAERLVQLAVFSREHRTALEAIRTIMERTDGKVAERVDIELRVRELAERYGMDASEVLREADGILAAVNSR